MTMVNYDHSHFYIGWYIMLREARKKQTKELIVFHAMSLFKKRGYENVTVEEITTACGIAKGTFFNYFPKKEQILLYVTDSYMDLLNEMVQRHQQGNLKDRFVHIFDDLVVIYLKYFDLMRLTLEETIRVAMRSTSESTNIARFQEVICDIFEKERENGSLRSKWDSSTCASVLLGIFLNTLISYSYSLNQEKIMEKFKQQLDIVWEGITNE